MTIGYTRSAFPEEERLPLHLQPTATATATANFDGNCELRRQLPQPPLQAVRRRHPTNAHCETPCDTEAAADSAAKAVGARGNNASRVQGGSPRLASDTGGRRRRENENDNAVPLRHFCAALNH